MIKINMEECYIGVCETKIRQQGQVSDCENIQRCKYSFITVPETNSSHLKMDGWNISFLLGPGRFSGALAVSFRECNVR